MTDHPVPPVDPELTRRVLVLRWKKWWPLVRFTREMKWVPGCRSLIVGPYEIIWRFRND